MWQLVLAQVPVQRRVICPDKHGYFDVSFYALCLPRDYAEAVWADWMSCGAGVLVDWGWGPEMFFEPILKWSASLSNVLLRTVNMWALEFVYDPTLLDTITQLLTIVGGHNHLFGKYSMWGCHNHTPILPYTSPHPLYPIHPNTLLPCFSGAIFGEYLYLFI